jgi:hypothetical protein
MPKISKAIGPARPMAEILRLTREIAATRAHPKTTIDDIRLGLAENDNLLDEETKTGHPVLSMDEMADKYANRRVAVLVTRLEPNGFGGRVFLACDDLDEFEAQMRPLREKYPSLPFSSWAFGEMKGGPEGLLV